MPRAMRPFEVLFLTNFSDSCYRAIPALAQLGDEIDLRLTILHAYGERHANPGQLETHIRSFFPEADHYASCRRVLTNGSPFEAVARMREERPIDMVVAPAGDPLGLPRLGHTSLRSRLSREAGVPMWTLGHGTTARRLARPTRNVACCIDMDATGLAHLRLAGEYAEALNATLHIVQLLPDVDEGSLATLAFAEPFDERHAARQVRRAGVSVSTPPETQLTDRGGLQRTLARCDADMVFLDGRRWLNRRWFGSRVSSDVDALPCPAICVDAGRDNLTWQLSPNPARLGRYGSMFDLTDVRPAALVGAH